MRSLAVLVTCALVCGSTAAFAAGGAAAPQIVDLTVRPSGADLARVPGRGDAFAAVYDDRLSSSALRYAERRDGRWNVIVIARAIDGRPVGREPTLAISHHGLRLAVFRTDIDLADGQAGNGTLYAARSPDGRHWYIDKIDPDMYLNRNYAPLDVRMKAYIKYARGIPQVAKDIKVYSHNQHEGRQTYQQDAQLDWVASMFDPPAG